MRILITGATGFVGQALIKTLLQEEHRLIAAVRAYSSELPFQVEQKVIGDLGLLEPHYSVMDGSDNIEVVIHTAARVHIMTDDVADPLTEFRKINVTGTIELAKQAEMAGVKRFIYLSSIKVNGESTDGRPAFSEVDESAPEDDYARSKLEAEQALFDLAKTTAMEIVVIRPPLIYGPGVKANFASMINIIKKGLPLPFGAIFNQRSMLAIDNLVDFIKCCITHPAAANQVFVLADGEDVSTTQLLKRLAVSYHRPTRLLSVPTSWMTFVAKLLGKRMMTDRLFGNLQIDISKAKQLLGWKSLVSMDQQLKKMAEQDQNSKIEAD